MIGVIDYGMGNLYSVSRALERMGHSARIIADPEEVRQVDGLILPGVGAFGDAMLELKKRGLVEAIREASAEKPLLGICLGMQLLFTSSDEHGYHQGLNLFSGHVKRLEGDINIPHMGWNQLQFNGPHPLLKGVEEGYAYFVHSHRVLPDNREDVLAVTDYHQNVTAIVGRHQLFGMQFHPEKSGKVGIRLLDNFAQLCREGVGCA
ncbi:imidazole glycerol phosphate synthase subunit HisH [Desmospora activa]|uniref:Imidazole glycerol phosphate synthase subunit HisH n=1 Tax=Desmospora activa DSM 45169 TaxID=1121389 RepID=A0A2T4Z436_9BACL|nr:imidazole glycerol phosphate synthase subunit HisH [Desmospora activa]PTM56636.1 glutamine amidotransferase [Desmospora activa DSM 45169]